VDWNVKGPAGFRYEISDLFSYQLPAMNGDDVIMPPAIVVFSQARYSFRSRGEGLGPRLGPLTA